jgi:predicted nuclease of predicted toxin-antitoxin system
MRFLADESCDAAIVRALRIAGHDVATVSDSMRGATDRSVLDAAQRGRRLLITEDKDFGELVFAAGEPTIGVVLLRYGPAERGRLTRKVVDFVSAWHAELAGSFVVIGPARTRIRRLPPGRG